MCQDLAKPGLCRQFFTFDFLYYPYSPYFSDSYAEIRLQIGLF
jgi:hypothetical protein